MACFIYSKLVLNSKIIDSSQYTLIYYGEFLSHRTELLSGIAVVKIQGSTCFPIHYKYFGTNLGRKWEKREWKKQNAKKKVTVTVQLTLKHRFKLHKSTCIWTFFFNKYLYCFLSVVVESTDVKAWLYTEGQHKLLGIKIYIVKFIFVSPAVNAVLGI